MKMRRREDFGQLRGWKKFFHSIAMFILLPLRKPLITIVFLVALFLAPIFAAKVAPKDVHIWYKDKIVAFYEAAKAETFDKIKLPTIGEETVKPNEDLIEVSPKRTENMRRQMFEKAKSDPQAVDILKQREMINPNLEAVEEEVVVPTRANQEAEAVKIAEANPDDTGLKFRKNLALKYLDIPEDLTGAAVVVNANALQVDGVYIFLYGIYANSSSIEGVKAETALRKVIGNRAVHCSIVAYTAQDVATGFCFIGNQNLNQMLVDEGISKNVAL